MYGCKKFQRGHLAWSPDWMGRGGCTLAAALVDRLPAVPSVVPLIEFLAALYYPQLRNGA